MFDDEEPEETISREEFMKILENIANNSKPLDKEIVDLINKNIWELLL